MFRIKKFLQHIFSKTEASETHEAQPENPGAFFIDVENVELANPPEESPSVSIASTESRKKCSKIPHKGFLLGLLASFTFSLGSVFIKVLNKVSVKEKIPIFELVMFRFLIVFILSVVVVIVKRLHPFPEGWRWKLVVRGIFGSISLPLQFFSIDYLPLADAEVINNSYPAFVAIFSRLFLKEPCAIVKVVVIGMSLSGVVLVARPSAIFGQYGYYSDTHMIGVCLGLAGVLTTALGIPVTRALKSAHFSVVLLNYSAISFLATACVTYFQGDFVLPYNYIQWLLIIGIGLVGFIGQWLLTTALQNEEAGPVSIAQSTGVVFAFCWQISVFDIFPNWICIIGASLVLTSSIISSFREIVVHKPKDSLVKRWFWWLQY